MKTKEELITAVNERIEKNLVLMHSSFDYLKTNLRGGEVPTGRLINIPRDLKYCQVLLMRLQGYKLKDIGVYFGFKSERTRQLSRRGMRLFHRFAEPQEYNQAITDIYESIKSTAVDPDTFKQNEIKIAEIKKVTEISDSYISRRKGTV